MDKYYNNYDIPNNFLISYIIIILLFVLVVLAFFIACNWIICKKSGRKGWEAVIPIYSTWVLVEIAEVNWWWFLISIFSSFFCFVLDDYSLIFVIVSVITNLVIYTNIARKFGESLGFGIAVALFPFIGLPILAFGGLNYKKEIIVPSNGIFGGNPLNKPINNNL